MKKVLAVCLSAILMFTGLFAVSAVDVENRVFSEPISAGQGKRISIPIQIEGNTGLMGFVIYVNVDRSVFTPISATKGEILSGAFEDSISVTNEGAFWVIYSGTEDVTQDGTLFTLQFDVDSNAIGDKTIELSFSPRDTFNENWQKVTLNCDTVQVSITESTTEEPITEPDEPKVEQKLSERIIAWWNRLPKVLHYILAVFVVPLAFVISMFE